MGTTTHAVVDARCPLCGSTLLSVSRAGRVLAEDMHFVPIGSLQGGRGFSLCDDCGVLADLPSDLVLN
jgi:hypothetical protein